VLASLNTGADNIFTKLLSANDNYRGRFLQTCCMKTKLFLAVLIVAQLRISTASEPVHTEDFVVHEWGTFTSVQGADGIPLEWNPLITTELPSFVYDLKKPSGDPRRLFAGLITKDSFRTLQRMETPVLYFYSEAERTVDVTVKFPEGRITEWFPQARDFGPSTMQPRALLAELDTLANKAGVAGVNFSSIDTKQGISESLVRWADVRVFPGKQHGDLQALMPGDASGSHYYAARETDADWLRVHARVNGNTKPEYEKFLFYRGIGNFKTPLQVTLSGDGEAQVSLRNTGGEALHHLFVLAVRHGQGRMQYLDGLAAGADTTVKLDPNTNPLPVSELVELISQTLRPSLVREGLYEREAAAMVKTWRDSWFEEQGLRVLYVLPRAWTDRVLPITIEPKPKQLVRVMVGRAEMITPSMEWDLMKQIARYSDADGAAREQIIEDTRKLGLGRFAEATTRRLVSKISHREFNRLSWELLEAVSKRQPQPKVLAQW
jgi:hypothetical protein